MKYHDRVFFTFINQTKWACLSVAVCLLTICCHLSYAEKTTSFKHVLILHSYHDSYPWTKEEMKGIQSVLGKEPDGIEMHVMYMDTKKIYNDNYLKLFYGMLAYKMKMVRYDAILLTDNDAFDFIRKHRQGVFKDIPVFFCGISNFDDSLLQGDSKMTGVVENSDYRSTIEIALQLRPMAEQVVVISDSTLTGQLHENQTRLLVPLFQGRAQFEFISLAKFSMDELLERLNQLKDDSVVFLLGHFIDKTGRIFSQAEAMGLIVSASRVPVFVLTDTRVNSGVVGGKVVCGFYQGKKAAEMLLQYATGKSIERIPVIKESPNRYMFDYKALKRFEIPFSALPQDSLILNKPVSYYKINKHRVNTALMIGGVFLVLFSFLGLNISKRKRMEKTLLEYEKQFMKVFNASPNAMGISCIKEGRFLEINENFSSVMGFQREEVLGKTALELQLWVDLEERQSFVESMMKYGYYKNREVLMRHKSGQILFILFSGAIIEFNEQKCILSVAQDITERKKIEEELLKARKIESLAILAGGIAHDFNNILVGIMGNLSLARRELIGFSGRESENIIEILTEAERASVQARNLTHQLLNFSMGDSPVKKTGSIASLLKESASFVLRGSKVHAEFVLDKEIQEVEMDEGQINQVIHNVLINSMEAMPEGGCIQISASNHEIKSGEGLPLSPGRYVKVTVKDQGVGIPDSILSKIFDPYFTTKKKGSGLGLANAYSIIQRHLGHIMAESEPGKGTVFTFFLPALTKKTDAKETDSHQVPLKSGSHKKILVMDDEDIVRDLLVKILSLLEYEVDSAKEGQEAIDKYLKSLSSGKPYHAVILDLTVPGGMGGRETMQELIKINPQIKALVSSGYSMDTILADYKQCGFMAVLSKPYQVEKLSDILSKILD